MRKNTYQLLSEELGVSPKVLDSISLAEWFWESQPERVKAPYGKGKRTRQDPEYHETRETLWEGSGTTP